jgi:hypothetical protein
MACRGSHHNSKEIKMSRKQRSKEDLLKASEHLRYEYKMFNETANALSKREFNNNTIIKYALIESFVIHTRNLLDFLYKDPIKDDDIRAGYFLDDQEIWQSKRPEKSRFLGDISHRANKEVAHLTSTRYDVNKIEGEPWPYLRIRNEINQIFREFLQLAQYLSPEIKSAMMESHQSVSLEPNASVTTSAIWTELKVREY